MPKKKGQRSKAKNNGNGNGNGADQAEGHDNNIEALLSQLGMAVRDSGETLATGRLQELVNKGAREMGSAPQWPGRAGAADVLRAQYRLIIGRCTRHAINDGDPCGDGDQSPVSSASREGQDFRSVWGEGGDFNPMDPDLRSAIPKHYFLAVLGVYPNMQRLIEAIKESPEQNAMANFLELRTSVLRLNLLMATIVGARFMGKSVIAPHYEANARHADVARLLLDNGARVNAKDVAGFTCLHHATSGAADNAATLEIARLLIERGADPNARNRFNETPLYEVIMAQNLDNVRLLMAAGADPYLDNGEGLSPAGMAALGNPLAHKLISAFGRKRAAVGKRVRLRGVAAGEGGDGVLEGALGFVRKFVCNERDGSEFYSIEFDNEPGVDHAFTAEQFQFEDGSDVVEEDRACGNPTCRKQGVQRCSRCLSATYCGRPCQVAHWPLHKKTCKKQEKRQIILGARSEKEDQYLRNLKPAPSVAVDAKDCEPGAQDAAADVGGFPAAGRSLIIKVQVPTTGDGGLLVYDQAHKFKRFIDRDNPAYADLRAAVESSELRFKAYFTAVTRDFGSVAIAPEPLPLQPW